MVDNDGFYELVNKTLKSPLHPINKNNYSSGVQFHKSPTIELASFVTFKKCFSVSLRAVRVLHPILSYLNNAGSFQGREF